MRFVLTAFLLDIYFLFAFSFFIFPAQSEFCLSLSMCHVVFCFFCFFAVVTESFVCIQTENELKAFDFLYERVDMLTFSLQ